MDQRLTAIGPPHKFPGFYQSPTNYTATETVITALGETQEFQLGGLIKRTYLDPTSPTLIAGISSETVVATQLTSTVDGGGEGGVIFDSAMALWQVRRRGSQVGPELTPVASAGRLPSFAKVGHLAVEYWTAS